MGVIADMIRAGVDPDLVAKVADEIADARVRGAIDAIPKRSAGSIRQERYRRNKASQSVTNDDCDACNPSPSSSPSSSPPITPLITTSSSSPTENARERASFARMQFEKFWQAWPHKVGKPAAEKSFAKVSGELDAILDGLQRYIRDKPPNRDWLNPATFLNQRRWEDSPAPTNVALFTPSNAPRKVRIDRDSKQGKAWEAHMASLGKRIPWANSAWYFESEWPPPDAPIPFTEAAE